MDGLRQSPDFEELVDPYAPAMDKPPAHLWRRILRAVLGSQPVLAALALVGSGFVGVWSWPLSGTLRPIANLERLAYDARLARHVDRAAFRDVVVVGFDRDTEAKTAGEWPPQRRWFAQALDNLHKDGARVIALDVLFELPSDRAEDLALHQAMLRVPRLVVGARLDRDPNPRVARKSWVGPYRSEDDTVDFEANAVAGLTEVPMDDDGVVRRWVRDYPHLGERVPSFAAAVASMAGSNSARAPETLVTIDPIDLAPIPSSYVRFAGGLSQVEQPADLADVALGRFSPGTFRDKVVLIGVTGSQLAKELGDVVINSATSQRPQQSGGAYRRDMPGVVLQAHLVRAAMAADYVRAPSDLVRALVGLGLTLLTLKAAQHWTGIRGIGAMLLGVAAFAAGSHFLAPSHIWVPWASCSVWALSAGFGQGWLDRNRLRRRWAGYVSPGVFRLIADGDEEIVRKRYVATVMFVDLRGFTSIAASLSPEATLDLLDRFFERAVPCVLAEDGTVDKFLGDGLLAVFGAPVSQEDAAQRAVRAALAIRAAVQGLSDVSVGIALATGPLVAGHVGTKSRHEFTVIGDVVNLASRLQSEAGPNQILIDRATRDALGQALPVGDGRELDVRGLGKQEVFDL